MLYRKCGCITAKLRALHKFLCQCFHAAQHSGRHFEPHHFQSSYGLVQLLSSNAQLTGIQRRQIRPTCKFGIAHKTLQRLDGTIKRFAQFIKHPGQRAQIRLDGCIFNRLRRFRMHVGGRNN